VKLLELEFELGQVLVQELVLQLEFELVLLQIM